MIAIGVLLLALYAFFILSQTAKAHGGGIPQIANAPIGEYIISVWTDPEPMTVGTIHITVGLAQENEAMLNRNIQVIIEHTSDGQMIEARATHENSANKFLYEADLEVRRAGDYRFVVRVDDLADTVSFVDMVEGESLMNNTVVMGGIIALVAVVAVVGLRQGGRDG